MGRRGKWLRQHTYHTNAGDGYTVDTPRSPYDPRYIQDPNTDRIVFKHLDGVPWHKVDPLPPEKHRCWMQSWGISGGKFVRRCACGAISMDDVLTPDDQVYWMDRNETRKSRERRAEQS